MSNCLRLLDLRRLPPANTRKNSHPEGRQAEWDTHRTDYEGAGGKEVFQWLPGINPDIDRLDKNGVQGLPGALLGTFPAREKYPGSGPGRPGDQVMKRLTSGAPGVRGQAGPVDKCRGPGARSPRQNPQ